MKEITSFKLSDGRIIENKEEAINLQKEIDLKKAIYDFAQREGLYEENKEFIYSIITNNIDELSTIFSKYN